MYLTRPALFASLLLLLTPSFAQSQEPDPAPRKDLNERVLEAMQKMRRGANRPTAPVGQPAPNPAQTRHEAKPIPEPNQEPAAPEPPLLNDEPESPARPAEPPKAPTPREYTLQEGDTLSDIAKKFYGSRKQWIAIAKANPTVDPTRLKVGQKIRLPESEAIDQPTEPQDSTPTPPPAAPAGESSVVVRSGDTLGAISQRVYGTSKKWREIFEANKDQLPDPNRLRVGMKLKLPAPPAINSASAPAPSPRPSGASN